MSTLEVGETIVLGGSVTPGVRRVTVVGVLDAEGTLNDMLVMPLEATQGIAAGNRAYIIRIGELSAAQKVLVEPASSGSGVVVTGVDAPASAPSE